MFEPQSARRAFPCFDTPGIKTPFSLTLKVPNGATALSNAPIERREVVEGGEWEYVRFAPTPPLATYALGLVVGPYAVSQALEATARPRVRLVAPSGMLFATDHEQLLTSLNELLMALEDLIGAPLSLEKLDVVFVPALVPAAMEHPGLVLVEYGHFRDAAEDPSELRLIFAHELAHMWFGNTVTLSEWPQLWMNEGFATWLSLQLLERLGDAYAVSAWRVREGVDAALSAAPWRPNRAILDVDEAADAFDAKTYDKGAAIVGMLARWVGVDAFRARLHDYLMSRIDGHMDLEGFLDALPADASDVAMGFLSRSGAPLVDVNWRCEEGRLTVSVEQRPLRPPERGSEEEPLWRFPMCVMTSVSQAPHCFRVDARSQVEALELDRCPTWLHPRADDLLFYRWRLPLPALEALAQAHWQALPQRAQRRFLSNLDALLDVDAIGPIDYLNVLGLLLHNGADEAQIWPRLDAFLMTIDDPVLWPALGSSVAAALGPLDVASRWDGGDRLWIELLGDTPRGVKAREALAKQRGEAPRWMLPVEALALTPLSALQSLTPADAAETWGALAAQLRAPTQRERAGLEPITLAVVLPLLASLPGRGLFEQTLALLEEVEATPHELYALMTLRALSPAKIDALAQFYMKARSTPSLADAPEKTRVALAAQLLIRLGERCDQRWSARLDNVFPKTLSMLYQQPRDALLSETQRRVDRCRTLRLRWGGVDVSEKLRAEP